MKDLSTFNKRMIFAVSVLLVCSTVTGFIKLPQFFYFFSLGVVGLWMFLRGGRMRFAVPLMTIFLIICALSIIVNQPPSYFKAWQRLAGFSIIVMIVSPMLESFKISRLRNHLLNNILRVLVVLSVGSFFCYFLGINFFIRDGEVLNGSDAGHFSGLYNHSMMLAPMAALASLYCFSQFLCMAEKKRKRIWMLCTFCCASASLLAASRGAALGLAMGFLAVVFQYSRLQKKMFSKYILYTMVVLAIVGPLTINIWGNVVAKNEANLEMGGSVMYSREAKMDARIYEIKENFLTGVGFCVIDESVDVVDKLTGTIEPNSSWLASFSMMGIFGFLVFLAIYVKAVICSFEKIHNRFLSLSLCGIIIFWGFHMIIEGYAFAAGSILCCLYWLTTEAIYAASSTHNI